LVGLVQKLDERTIQEKFTGFLAGNAETETERKRRGSFEQWIRPTNRMKKKEGDEGNEQVGAGPVQDGLSPNQASMFPTEETGQTSG